MTAKEFAANVHDRDARCRLSPIEDHIPKEKKNRRQFLQAGCAVACASVRAALAAKAEDFLEADLLVFDSTPAGIMAAIAAANEGLGVVLVTEDRHVGGMRTSGLSVVNSAEPATIGGLTRQFHDRIYNYYVSQYGASSEQVTDCQYGFRFEPHVSEAVFLRWLTEARVKVLTEEVVLAVRKEAARIIALTTDHGRELTAGLFVDASYEGDLFALAGCSYRVGREGSKEYGESLAGVRFPPERRGEPDGKTQRFVYRLCLTNDPDNQVAFRKPSRYEPDLYAYQAARLRHPPPAGLRDVIPLNWVPNRKTDSRVGEWTGGPSSAYPQATREERRRIAFQYRDYSAGYLWFLLTDDSVPRQIRRELMDWGHAKDEFVDNDHWPYHIYVREARRLAGDFVMTQRDVMEVRYQSDSVALGDYRLDVHPVQFVPDPAAVGGRVEEGDLGMHHLRPYEIPYRSLLAKRSQAENLLVPVCLSATHVAYSTLRMEPVYMKLGHAAGVAAALSFREDKPLHAITIERLQDRLREQGQILDARAF